MCSFIVNLLFYVNYGILLVWCRQSVCTKKHHRRYKSMKKIRTGLSVIRFLALITSALGLVGCALAQVEGSFWDQNYEVAFDMTGCATCIVVFLAIVEIFCRISIVHRDTPIYINKLISGISLFVVPFLWAAFIASDVRALHLAFFIAGCGACHAIGFLPKSISTIVEVETVVEFEE